ncbi:hypothetical protein [Halorussus litoreus]|uniref:hypothetical protein n=1 Tax=Halorussus litoreus TaxID=1710536 RepID=UPI000E26D9CC|nr:hypothetical protein [Halorussus litoreus]
MRRRQLLALSGSLLAGSAGCLSASAPEATDPESTDTTSTESHRTTERSTTAETTSTETTSTVEYADLAVELDALQPGLVTMNTPDSIGVSGRDQRYLLVDVSTGEGGEAPARDEFAFEFDGATHRPEPMDEPWRVWRFYDDEDALYDRGSGGLLVFEFPEAEKGDFDSVPEFPLTWPGGEWQPDETLRRRLSAPEPPLSVSLDVPETLATHESPTVSVTVENEGDLPGRFVAGLNRIGPRVAYAPVARVSMLVPAGESETWEFTDDSLMAGDYSDERIGDDESDMTYHLDWADGDVRKGIRYVEV